MNRYIIVILGILLILNPNNVPQFLLWIYPFLIIESIVYNKIPIYIINILWISCLAIFIFAEPLPYIMLHNNIAMNQLSWKLARLFSPFINKYFAALIGFFYVSLLTFIIFYTALNKEIHFKRRL